MANIYTRLNPERLEYLSVNGTVINLQNLPGYRSTEEAQRIHCVFTTYFNGVAGRLTCQDMHLQKKLNAPRDQQKGDFSSLPPAGCPVVAARGYRHLCWNLLSHMLSHLLSLLPIKLI